MNLSEIEKQKNDLIQAELAKDATIRSLVEAKAANVARIAEIETANAEIDVVLKAHGFKTERKARESKPKGGLSEKAKA